MAKWHAVISGRIEPLFQISKKYERTLHNVRVCAERAAGFTTFFYVPDRAVSWNSNLIYELKCPNHRVHIFTRDETGSVYLPTQLERTLKLYW